MPAIGSAALSAVRALVGSMATHPAGDKTGDQLTLFQQAPRQIVAARESALANSNRVLKIRTGTYLLVPKRQADQIPNAADYIISDGWLVSKDIRKNTQMATAASKETMKPISYMTIEVKVERTSLGCSNIKKG
jgi:hypothetical protein